MTATIPDYVSDIGTYLQTHGIGTVATTIFYDGLPSNIKNCIVLFEHDGLPAVPTLGGTMILFKPRVKIIVRNESTKTAMDTARLINSLLNLMINTQVGSTWVKKIETVVEPNNGDRTKAIAMEWQQTA